MLPFPLFLALKYLRPKRSFISVVMLISILGVLLGVAILVIVLSVMTGFDAMWRDRLLSFRPHITVTSRRGIITDELALCDQIETVTGVTGACPSVETRVMLRSEDGQVAAPVVLGVDPDRIGRISMIPGNASYMREGEFRLEDDTIVIGIDLAHRLGLMRQARVLVYSPATVGDPNVFHLPEELRVAGIFDMGMRDFDAGYVFTSIAVARDLVGIDEGAFSILVMVEDPLNIAIAAQAVREAAGPLYHIATWEDHDQILLTALRHEKTMMAVLLTFITIVAIFCVTNTLIVVTVQKTREIGLLKALGFPTVKIALAFVLHGLVQCAVGTLGGIATGLAILLNLKNIVGFLAHFNIKVFDKQIYGLDEIPWATTPGELIDIAAFVMIFCTLASILPAWRAARLDPVQALRQE